MERNEAARKLASKLEELYPHLAVTELQAGLHKELERVCPQWSKQDVEAIRIVLRDLKPQKGYWAIAYGPNAEAAVAKFMAETVLAAFFELEQDSEDEEPQTFYNR